MSDLNIFKSKYMFRARAAEARIQAIMVPFIHNYKLCLEQGARAAEQR